MTTYLITATELQTMGESFNSKSISLWVRIVHKSLQLQPLSHQLQMKALTVCSYNSLLVHLLVTWFFSTWTFSITVTLGATPEPPTTSEISNSKFMLLDKSSWDYTSEMNSVTLHTNLMLLRLIWNFDIQSGPSTGHAQKWCNCLVKLAVQLQTCNPWLQREPRGMSSLHTNWRHLDTASLL